MPSSASPLDARTKISTLLHMDKQLQARFYRSPAGNEPVKDWLRSLDKEFRKLVGSDIFTVEVGWPIGMPHAAPWAAGFSKSAPTFQRYDCQGSFLCRKRLHVSAGWICQKDPENPAVEFRACQRPTKGNLGCS